MYVILILVPSPTVIVAAFNTQTVGQSLTLQCEVTTVLIGQLFRKNTLLVQLTNIHQRKSMVKDGGIIRPTIVNSLFPVLVREKYHAGGRLLFIILLKIIIISRINATYTLGI